MPYYWNGNQFVFTPSTFGGYTTPQTPQAQSLLSSPPSLMSPMKTNYSQGGDAATSPQDLGPENTGFNGPNFSGLGNNISSHISNNPAATVGGIAGIIGSMATGVPGLGYGLGSIGRGIDIANANTRLSDYGQPQMSYLNAFNPFNSIDLTENESMAGFATDPSITNAALAEASFANPANIAAANMTDAASIGIGGFGTPGFSGQTDPADASIGVNGGGGPGSSKIICSYLHQIGLMDYHTFFEDQKFGVHLERTDPKALKGYHLWAGSIVRLMQRHPGTIKIVFRLAMPWARHIASLAKGGGGNAWGAILLAIGIPICRWLGQWADYRQNVKKLQEGG